LGSFSRRGELRRAIELKPNYATAQHWLGIFLAAESQRRDAAIAAAHRAEELDPLSLIISADTGFDLILLRRYDEAITQLQKDSEVGAELLLCPLHAGLAYIQKGMYSQAIAECRESLRLNPEPWGKALLAVALARSGGRGEAMKLRRRVEERDWAPLCTELLCGDCRHRAERKRRSLRRSRKRLR